jgi:hypothetical protein
MIKILILTSLVLLAVYFLGMAIINFYCMLKGIKRGDIE